MLGIPKEPIVEVLSCVLGTQKAIYLSTPMTNGPRLIEWLSQNRELTPGTQQYEERFVREVLSPNCEEGAFVATKIREITGELVIDPTCFEVKNWDQVTYIDFWCAVIKRFAREVRFNSGWEYSNGCVSEYAVSAQNGIPTYNVQGDKLTLKCAIEMISIAATKLEQTGLSNVILYSKIEALREL